MLQKCGHTGKSNYGLKLSVILMFLTIYGVEKCSVTTAHITGNHIDTFPNTVIDLTQCITESVLISFDVFPNVYPSIHNVFKIIRES